MKITSKRNGVVLALVATIAALLLEPVNGPKRRARMQRVLEPAGRPLQAARQKLWPKDKEAQEPGYGTLVERLQQVAVRAQGKIDAQDQPQDAQGAPIAAGAVGQQGSAPPREDAAPIAAEKKPRGRRKKPAVEG